MISFKITGTSYHRRNALIRYDLKYTTILAICALIPFVARPAKENNEDSSRSNMK